MANAKKPMPIRLSNRTAIGLRKTAQRVRGAWLIAMGIFAMIATVAAVYLGFSWLPAVPLTLLGAGVIVLLMMLISRSQYLLLISQAICTEAASREMNERASEQKRRRQAIEQLAVIRADVREAQKNGLPAPAARTEESILFDLLTGTDPTEDEIMRRRRRQEDDEMFGEDYREEKDAQTDVDMLPPRPAKKPKPPVPPAVSVTQSTRVVASSAAAAPAAVVQTDATPAPRRRRRSAPAQTAPLQLIRNDQAQ